MAFIKGEIYKTNHTEDSELEVTHLYNPTFCKLNVVGTTKHFAAKDVFTMGKHLMLAHIDDKDTQMTKIKIKENEGKIKW